MQPVEGSSGAGDPLDGVRVVVVGAGISGLAAGWSLVRRGAHVQILESGDRAGGRIRTYRENGFLVEGGPNAVDTRDAAVQELVDASSIQMVRPTARDRFLVHNGRLVAMPRGPKHFLSTRIVSPAAKLRLLAEPFVQKPDPPREESVEAFVTRRFGKGVLHVADAFITGVHAGDPSRLSARRVMRPLVEMEQNGGVLRNLRRTDSGGGLALAAPVDGMEHWAKRLARRLPVRYGCNVTKVDPRGHPVTVTTDEDRLEVDHVVLATDSTSQSGFIQGGPEAPPVAPVTVVAIGVKQEIPQGYGFLAPEREERFVLGATFESSLFPGRSPKGIGLLRAFVGGSRHPERADLPDDEIVERVWEDLHSLGIVDGTRCYARVIRTQGIPQLEVGQRDPGTFADHSRVHRLGMGINGVGVVDLVKAARDATGQIRASPDRALNRD